MKNRRKKQIRKLVSSLCAVGTLGSYSGCPAISGWSKLKWCDKKTSDDAAAHLLPCIKKAVIPLINEKTGLNIPEKGLNYEDFDDADRLKDLNTKITDFINQSITDNEWNGFVGIIMDKYRKTQGVLSEKKQYVLDAFSEALMELNPEGSFDPHGLFYQPPEKVSFADMVKYAVFGHGYIKGLNVWQEEIRFQLRYKMSAITKSLIGLGIIAGGVTGGSALISQMRSWSDDRRQRKLLEHKAKFQKKEDELAQLFANLVDIDPKKINVDKLHSMLLTEAKDWPYASDEIQTFIDIYIGIIMAKQEDPLAKCPPIILIGPPGCGKSEWLKRVIKCTFACIEDEKSPAKDKKETNWEERCIFINQDKIDNKSSVSPRDQVSGSHEEKREDVTITCYSDSAKANKFGKGIHLKYIDEIEKLPIDVILSIWDTADSGGRAIALATGNGNPADYIKGQGAYFKEAFEDRAIILEIPTPDKTYIRTCIEKLIAELNEKTPDKAPIVISHENLDSLVNVCTSNRSVATMRSPMLGLQLEATKDGRSSTPIKVNPNKPKPERLIIEESHSINITPIKT